MALCPSTSSGPGDIILRDDAPSAASSTILARCTSRSGRSVVARTRRSDSSRIVAVEPTFRAVLVAPVRSLTLGGRHGGSLPVAGGERLSRERVAPAPIYR
jgi:hypothetical protein